MMFVRLSVCLALCLSVWDRTGIHCDYTVRFSADLSLWLDSPMILTPDTKHVHLFPAVFFQFHQEEKWGMDYRSELRPGHSTVVSIRFPETVLLAKGTAHCAWLG